MCSFPRLRASMLALSLSSALTIAADAAEVTYALTIANGRVPELKPGTVTEMTFTARATGRFTVEPHIGRTPSGGHAHGAVLVTIEVYP